MIISLQTISHRQQHAHVASGQADASLTFIQSFLIWYHGLMTCLNPCNPSHREPSIRPSIPPKLRVMPTCDRIDAAEGGLCETSRVLMGIVLADEARLLLGLEVVEEDAALLGLLTPVLDDDARAVDNLAGVTLTVDLAC